MCACAARLGTASPMAALLTADPVKIKMDAAAIVLQRLFRGRAAQTRMYEGLQTRLALIRVSIVSLIKL